MHFVRSVGLPEAGCGTSMFVYQSRGQEGLDALAGDRRDRQGRGALSGPVDGGLAFHVTASALSCPGPSSLRLP